MKIEEYENQRQKQIVRMRSVTNYIMGVLFLGVGIFFLIYDKIGIDMMGRKPSYMDIIIGVMFVLYGGWRIYRGYKKNYFR